MRQTCLQGIFRAHTAQFANTKPKSTRGQACVERAARCSWQVTAKRAQRAKTADSAAATKVARGPRHQSFFEAAAAGQGHATRHKRGSPCLAQRRANSRWSEDHGQAHGGQYSSNRALEHLLDGVTNFFESFFEKKLRQPGDGVDRARAPTALE